MGGPFELDAHENERIFREEILPDYLDRCASTRSIANPRAIVMGGQMGAGKSRLSSLLQDSTRPAAIPIDGDELREFVPAYRRLKRSNPGLAIEASSKDSGMWVEKLISELASRRQNVLVEGTMRTFEPFERTAKSFRSHGYRVEAAILAVDGLISWQATVLRAEDMAASGQGMRTVSWDRHEEAMIGSLDTCEAICMSGLAHRIGVFGRDGRRLLDLSLVHAGASAGEAVRSVILAERQRPWTEKEKAEHDTRWGRVIDMMHARDAGGEAIDRAWAQRFSDAETRGYTPLARDAGHERR